MSRHSKSNSKTRQGRRASDFKLIPETWSGLKNVVAAFFFSRPIVLAFGCASRGDLLGRERGAAAECRGYRIN
jgi:hypothetical protein